MASVGEVMVSETDGVLTDGMEMVVGVVRTATVKPLMLRIITADHRAWVLVIRLPTTEECYRRI